jgi:hypothetical protein
MERQWYFIGIAFFGMINGIYNEVPFVFTLLHVEIIAPALLFGSVPLTYFMASLMLSTATIILAGIPAAIYEHFTGPSDDSSTGSLWIWLAGTALLTLPAMGNFLSQGL